MKQLRVGVTISSTLPVGAEALWASGINQNAIFLVQILSCLPRVSWAGFLTYPDVNLAGVASAFGLPSVGLRTVAEEIDVIIELGVRAARDEMSAFRARGGKLVSYMAGNAMVMNFESLANSSAHGEVLDHAGFDAVWITPQHWKMNRSYAALTRSQRVELAPHIWNSSVVEHLSHHFATKFRWEPQASAQPWRVGVFEPTVNVVKTFHLPLLVCEQAYRIAPDSIGRVLLFGASHLIGNPHFSEFCGNLDLSRSGRLFAEARHPVVSMLGTHVDAVVAHQWENALNYLYWDTLYGGFPLIHNSPDIEDAGYYYPAFDPAAGGKVLVEALASHASRIDAYREAARTAIARYDTASASVRARYAELLDQLLD